MGIPTAEEICLAHERIAPHIHRTAVLTCSSIDKIVGAEIFFKCENFQKVGAFKMRGATNTILSLSKNEIRNGVATHSSGNHAQAVALAAQKVGAKAFIVMPNSAPSIKKNAVIGYGAEVIDCKPTLQARESTLDGVLKKTGAAFVHPYNDYRIIAGQATAAKELLEDIEKLDVLMTPVGGGGLLSGTALSAYYFSPETKVIAGEPSGADDAFRSFKSGKLVPSINPKTIADGLLTSLGEKNFEIIQKYVSDILTVEENEILEALNLIWQRMKIVIEPSSAVPVAALIKNRQRFKGKRVGIVISGGNVGLELIH